MEPKEALTVINQTLRQVNTTADNHDLLREAVQTLAGVVNAQNAMQDEAKAEAPVES